MSEIYMEEWLAALNETDKVPKGWQTAKQLQDLNKSTKSKVSLRLKSLIRQKLVDVRRFRIKTTSNQIRNIPHYRLTKQYHDVTRDIKPLSARAVSPMRENAQRNAAHAKGRNRKASRA